MPSAPLKAAKPDLQPLRDAARPRVGAADADPAADVTVEHRRRLHRHERRGDAVSLGVAREPRVRVLLRAAALRTRGPTLRLPDHEGREAEDAEELREPGEAGEAVEHIPRIGTYASALTPSN